MLPSVKHIHRPLYPLSRFGDSVACVSLFTISTAFFKNYSRPADTSGTRFCFEPPQPPYRCTRSERKYVRCYISHFTCSPELGPGVSCVPLFTIPLGPSCCPFEFDRDVCGRSYFFVGPPALSSVAVGTGRAGVNFVAPISSRFTPVFGSRLQRFMFACSFRLGGDCGFVPQPPPRTRAFCIARADKPVPPLSRVLQRPHQHLTFFLLCFRLL